MYLPWEMPAGIWQEKHPREAAAGAAAAARWVMLAAVTAGWVPALFASALRVNGELRNGQNASKFPGKLTSSPIHWYQTLCWKPEAAFLPLIAQMINSGNDITFWGGG